MSRPAGRRVLIVDLNNFSRYPTLAVAYLVAVLRRAGMEVDVFSPLQTGVTGVMREARPGLLGLVRDRLGYRSAVSRSRTIRRARAWLAERQGPRLAREMGAVAAQFERRLASSVPDAVLISTYLMYEPLCRQMARACWARGVPVLIGGPYFYQPEVAAAWIDIEGISGLVGGEVELELPEIVEAMVAGEDLARFAGIWSPAARDGAGRPTWIAPAPLTQLDALPFPDFSDFPWERYPNRIIPIITGRGCGWGACTFCSDVTSTAGRTYRSRDPAAVLPEIEHQYQRHGARLFVFTDLKLNSNPEMWRALQGDFQRVAPGAQWVGSVHIDARGGDGLEPDDLRAASAAGMVRLTTGLESASDRVLRSMGKGTSIELTSRVLRDARSAGISVRSTMIVGYPGEEAADVDASAAFLRDHVECIERVSLNRFQLMTGTRIHRRLEREPAKVPGVTDVVRRHRLALLEHHYVPNESHEYRAAVDRLLAAVHRINRRPILAGARAFEGVM